jgi:hypothetical protein
MVEMHTWSPAWKRVIIITITIIIVVIIIIIVVVVVVVVVVIVITNIMIKLNYRLYLHLFTRFLTSVKNVECRLITFCNSLMACVAPKDYKRL